MNARRWLVALILALGAIGKEAAATESDTMRPAEVNGYELLNAEYLPFRGRAAARYPEDALVGFYPPAATAAAKACAAVSFHQVIELFNQNPDILREMRHLGGAHRFILWINDYSQSAERTFYRPARFWYSSGGSHDYRLGTWVWETTLSRTGNCEQPGDEQVDQVLAAAVKALGRDQR